MPKFKLHNNKNAAFFQFTQKIRERAAARRLAAFFWAMACGEDLCLL